MKFGSGGSGVGSLIANGCIVADGCEMSGHPRPVGVELLGRPFAEPLLLALAFSCSRKPPTSEQPNRTALKIGYFGDLTGPTFNFGRSAYNGVLMAADEINNAGGINGRRIDVVFDGVRRRFEFRGGRGNHALALNLRKLIAHQRARGIALLTTQHVGGRCNPRCAVVLQPRFRFHDACAKILLGLRDAHRVAAGGLGGPVGGQGGIGVSPVQVSGGGGGEAGDDGVGWHVGVRG